jgi:hypothetical protein
VGPPVAYAQVSAVGIWQRPSKQSVVVAAL